MKLTCEYCKTEPAVLLVVLDLEVMGRPRRVKSLIGEGCWEKNRSDAKRIASSVWVFTLTENIDIE